MVRVEGGEVVKGGNGRDRRRSVFVLVLAFELGVGASCDGPTVCPSRDCGILLWYNRAAGDGPRRAGLVTRRITFCELTAEMVGSGDSGWAYEKDARVDGGFGAGVRAVVSLLLGYCVGRMVGEGVVSDDFALAYSRWAKVKPSTVSSVLCSESI